MEKNASIVNFEKIGAYAAIIGLLFMFWSFWRDLHLIQSELRERIAKVEVKIEHIQQKIS